ncbi:MAG: aspartyl aminopeptidase [Acidimicrobiales bacterium]|jgi:aspartyl aminopeptidase
MPDDPALPNLVADAASSSADLEAAGLAARLIADISASPTPYHASRRAAALLASAGYTVLDLADPLPVEAGDYVIVHGGAMVAWRHPGTPVEEHGFCVVGAHTDSPNIRVRSNPDVSSGGWAQVGVETYGGLLANSWLDRDLGLAGRVSVRGSGGVSEHLVLEDRPILRIPQLAIHLDRDIRDDGLKLNPQQHLTPLWAAGKAEDGDFADYVAELAGVAAADLLAWELMAFDVQPPALVGRHADLLASARIDNQLSCFAATHALASLTSEAQDTGMFGSRLPVLVLYDHEEIGSASSTGAAGGFLGHLLERVSASVGADRVGHLEALTRSIVVSADGAHATHPNYVDRHEPSHQIAVNEGVVVKRNANQRYATDARSESFIRSVCADAGVPVQTYIHRNDLPCGSTIGPITASELSVATVDIGAPQLAMHSIREMAGTMDIEYLARTLRAAWSA